MCCTIVVNIIDTLQLFVHIGWNYIVHINFIVCLLYFALFRGLLPVKFLLHQLILYMVITFDAIISDSPIDEQTTSSKL